MKKEEIELKITAYEQKLRELREQLAAVAAQENERKRFVSSKEIIDLVEQHTGRQLNMSTIKRWADEGYLGEVIDEKETFPALQSKQGKKRFLYPKVDVYSFLYEKGYLYPAFEVLDEVMMGNEQAMIIDSALEQGEFYYTVQLASSFKVKKEVKESRLSKKGDECDEGQN